MILCRHNKNRWRHALRWHPTFISRHLILLQYHGQTIHCNPLIICYILNYSIIQSDSLGMIVSCISQVILNSALLWSRLLNPNMIWVLVYLVNAHLHTKLWNTIVNLIYGPERIVCINSHYSNTEHTENNAEKGLQSLPGVNVRIKYLRYEVTLIGSMWLWSKGSILWCHRPM